MREVHLESWEEFQQSIDQMMAERDQLVRESHPRVIPDYLFRGQASSDWGLETTLERARDKKWSFMQYASLALLARTQIETFASHRWESCDYEEFASWASSYQIKWREIPGYDLFVYLRHHGFPSPLLDWTRSPYVAAYFALSAPASDRVAIFCYLESVGKGKGGFSDRPNIMSMGPNVRSHPRHFLQQSEYTICLHYDDSWMDIAPHQSVFSERNRDQDLLTKFTLPSDVRDYIVPRLDTYNINEFSLFQSEESLLRTIAAREIEFSDRWIESPSQEQVD